MRKSSFGQKHQTFLDSLIEKFRQKQVIPHISRNVHVLDIGCGFEGKLLKKIGSNIKQGVGIDLVVSKLNLGTNIKLVSADANKKLPLKENAYDVVIMLALIEHLDNPGKTLKNIYKILKKNGTLLLTTPSKISKLILETLAFKFKLISKDEIQDHKRYYSKESLMNELVRAGFKRNKIDIKYFEFRMNIFAKAKK